MKKRVEDFESPTMFYAFCAERIADMARANGNEATLFDAIGDALKEAPKVVSEVVTTANKTAERVLGQNRCVTSSMILYVDTALRVVASQDDSGFLSPRNWNQNRVIEYCSTRGQEIARLAGENTLGRNLPQRAAWMLYALDRTGYLTNDLYVVELGAAAGLILDALCSPTKFLDWLRNSQQLPKKLWSTQPSREKFEGIGIDLVPPPNPTWAIACLGDDEAAASEQKFLSDFPKRSKVLKGDILDKKVWGKVTSLTKQASSRGKTPVIVASEVLYQVEEESRKKALQQIEGLTQKVGGVFMRSDGGQYIGLPRYEMFTIGEIRDKNFSLSYQRLLLKDKYRLEWEEIDE